MLKIANLKKNYGKKQILVDVSFEAFAGEILSVYGPNGSGKTTMFQILCGVVSSDDGTILFDEKNINDGSRETKNLIGFVPQDIALFNELTVKDNLISLSPLRKKERQIQNDNLKETLNLHDIWNKRIIELSGGMKRRANLAAALLGAPKILILDEPFAGIDKSNRDIIIDYLHMLKNDGLTIMVSSHSKEMLSSLSKNILSLNNGRVDYYGDIKEFFTKRR